MTTIDWLVVVITCAAALVCVLLIGCTADLWQEVEFTEEGVIECRARNVGYEDLPVFVFDTETADPLYRAGFGTSSTLTFTTIDGERITMDVDGGQPGYYCVKLEGV